MGFQLNQKIKHASGHTLLTNSVVVLMGLGLMVWSGWGLVRGPETIPAQDWAKLADDQAYVRIQGKQVLPTGLDETYQGHKTAGYTFLTDGKFIIAARIAPTATATSEVVGVTRVPIPWVKGKLENAVPKLPLAEPVLARLVVDTMDKPGKLVALGGVIALIGAAFALRAAAEMSNPKLHPVYSRLTRLGPAEQVLEALDKEMTEQSVEVRSGLIRIGEIRLSPHWLVSARGRLDVVALADLAWIYLHETKQTVNGIPSGTVRKLMCWHLDGRKVELGVTESAAVRILEHVAHGLPWVQVGYSDELHKAWKKKRRDFVAKVQASRLPSGQ